MATTTERPLSVELRASMFNEIFKPTVEKMFVPVRVDACDKFEQRKGAFAALGRCAKCNFKEHEHKDAAGHGFDSHQPKWEKVNGRFVRRDSDLQRRASGTISQVAPAPPSSAGGLENRPMFETNQRRPSVDAKRGSGDVQRSPSGVLLRKPSVGDLNRSHASIETKRSAADLLQQRESVDSLKQAFEPERRSSVLARAEHGKRGSNLSQSSLGSDGSSKRVARRSASISGHGVRSVRAFTKTTSVGSIHVGGRSHRAMGVDAELEGQFDGEVEDEPEEEEEEDVRRPSWAPPPLIDLDQEDQANQTTAPPTGESPTHKVMRRISWLKPRNASSSASDVSSGSSGMGSKRNSLKLLASQIRAKMSKAKDTWEAKIGDSMPNCNRCGRPIEPSHKIVTAGMARAHEVCPSKAESERGPRNPRYMVQKAQDRIVLTFRCDKETKQPYTFIFDLDHESKFRSLRMANTADLSLIYKADTSSHASLERKFKPPRTREFDVSVRYTHTFGFVHPVSNETVSPVFDAANKRVTVTKFCSANQVLHTIEARFVYDEENHVLSPDHLEFRFGVMPGAQTRLPTMFITSRGGQNAARNLMKRLEEKQQQQQQAGGINRVASEDPPVSTNTS